MRGELELARQVVDLVGDRAEAQVRVTRQRHGLTRFANSFIHQHVGEDVSSLSLTVASDARVAEAATSNLDPEALADFVDAAIAAAELQPADPYYGGLTPPSDVPDTDGHFDTPTAGTEPSRRAEGVRAFVEAGDGLQAAGYLDTEGAWVAFANSAGHAVEGRSTRATIDGIHQTGTSAGSAHQTSVRLGDLDAGAAGRTAADRARRSADFTDLDPGKYEVVLGPEAVSTISVFLAAYGFNAKSHLEGSSFVELGEQQFDERITLVDDATDPDSLGLAFDAEGTPKRRTVLIEDGVTRSLAHDRRTAKRAGTESTGHAVPGGASFGAFPTDVALRPGESTPDELIAEVERGLLITQFHYCRVLDPRTQVITGLTRNGTFLIEDGEVTGAVGNLRFTQSLLEALGTGNVLGIGNDLRFADSEFGPGMVRAPSLRLGSWNFSGGAKG